MKFLSVQRQLLQRAIPSGSGFEGSRYLAKWLVLGTIIGLSAGVGAILFSRSIDFATEFFLGDLVGYLPPGPVGEGEPIIRQMVRPWMLPVVLALGGLISGLLVFRLAPAAEGHGTDSAIDAIHHKRGRVDARIPPVKLLASAILIGSGGSGGREGPAAQISAGVGSLLARWLRLDARDCRTAVAAGMGAGIGAIFRAPLGGALMSAEILYIHDLEVEAIIPGLIASIVGYSLYGTIEGWEPIFGAQPGLAFEHPLTLVYYAALGVVCGVVGLLYARSFYGTARVFHRLRMPVWLKPALGGLLVGLLGLVVEGAIHTGYGWVQIGMTRELLTLPLWIVIALPFAKILATSLSIGSGGAGGIFGPGMVVGGMLGALFWRLGEGVLPQFPPTPAPFVIVGMIALFGGIAHAPLAVMLMVAEMTGNLSLLAPAMVAVALSTALVGDETIYRSQLPDRASAPAHRVRFSFPLLSTLLVRDAMVAAESAPSELVESGADLTLAVAPDASLDDALETLAGSGASAVPVVEQGVVVGYLGARDVVTAYRATLNRGVRRARALAPNTTLFEARLDAASPIAGRALANAKFPSNTLVVAISRGGEAIFPRGATRLEAGDVLMVMADPTSEPYLRAFLEGDSAPAARE